MPILDMRRLREVAGRPLSATTAEDAVVALGGLARWWLSDAAVALARDLADPEIDKLLGTESLPKLPDALGSCWVVCAVNGDFPMLRTAVVLPLRWVKGAPPSAALPTSLRELADHVVTQVAAIKDLPAVGGWGLQPDPRLGLDRTPLADDLFKTLESGWASLTGGLIAAVLGLTPKADVWASVQWNPVAGAMGVESLPAKLATAVAFGATAFAVALSQKEEAEKWVVENAADRLVIVPIASPLPLDAWTTLTPYLAALSQRPEPATEAIPDSFDRCRFYYRTLAPFSDGEKRFKQTHLQSELVRRCRAKLTAKHPTFAATHFATIVTRSADLQVLLAGATAATHCLLLHTADLGEAVAECLGGLGADVTAVPVMFRNTADMGDDIRRAVEAFAAGVPADRLVIDIKSATAKMKYWMGRAAKPGNWILNLEARMLNDRRNDPGSETPEVWQA